MFNIAILLGISAIIHNLSNFEWQSVLSEGLTNIQASSDLPYKTIAGIWSTNTGTWWLIIIIVSSWLLYLTASQQGSAQISYSPLIRCALPSWGVFLRTGMIGLCRSGSKNLIKFPSVGADRYRVEQIAISSIWTWLVCVGAYILMERNGLLEATTMTNVLSHNEEGVRLLQLNPALRDAFMLIHPPILFIGYLGVIASIGLSQRSLRYLLVLLTAGIGLGSWWAYNELGWGGFWFWDPVENASLWIWVFLLIFYHSYKSRDVQYHRQPLCTTTKKMISGGYHSKDFKDLNPDPVGLGLNPIPEWNWRGIGGFSPAGYWGGLRYLLGLLCLYASLLIVRSESVVSVHSFITSGPNTFSVLPVLLMGHFFSVLVVLTINTRPLQPTHI